MRTRCPSRFITASVQTGVRSFTSTRSYSMLKPHPRWWVLFITTTPPVACITAEKGSVHMDIPYSPQR